MDVNGAEGECRQLRFFFECNRGQTCVSLVKTHIEPSEREFCSITGNCGSKTSKIYSQL